jgi:hypothetical protein
MPVLVQNLPNFVQHCCKCCTGVRVVVGLVVWLSQALAVTFFWLWLDITRFWDASFNSIYWLHGKRQALNDNPFDSTRETLALFSFTDLAAFMAASPFPRVMCCAHPHHRASNVRNPGRNLSTPRTVRWIFNGQKLRCFASRHACHKRLSAL